MVVVEHLVQVSSWSVKLELRNRVLNFYILTSFFS